MSDDYTIRYARADELVALQQVELAAAKLFSEIGLNHVAEVGPLALDILQTRQSLGLIWVAVDGTDCPVGFLAARELDGGFHIEEIDVHPAHGRRGLGKRLIEAACAVAGRRGYEAVTLTTFRDVPWNAPFYEGTGFRVLEDRELGKELSALREREKLDWYPLVRVCMLRELSTRREAPEIQ